MFESISIKYWIVRKNSYDFIKTIDYFCSQIIKTDNVYF